MADKLLSALNLFLLVPVLLPAPHHIGGRKCCIIFLKYMCQNPVEGPGDYFSRAQEQPVENVYYGELYLAWHRGTYTAQALIKKKVREAEGALRQAEFLAGLCRLSGREPGGFLESGLKSCQGSQPSRGNTGFPPQRFFCHPKKAHLRTKVPEKFLQEGALAIRRERDGVHLDIDRREANFTWQQEIVFARDERRIEFRTKVDWRERHKILKVSFPTGARKSVSDRVLSFAEIPYLQLLSRAKPFLPSQSTA